MRRPGGSAVAKLLLSASTFAEGSQRSETHIGS